MFLTQSGHASAMGLQLTFVFGAAGQDFADPNASTTVRALTVGSIPAELGFIWQLVWWYGADWETWTQ